MRRPRASCKPVPLSWRILPAYRDEWIMPVAADPFAVPVEEKAAKLLGINAAALKAGADYCSSSFGSCARKSCSQAAAAAASIRARVRIWPQFTVTAIDKQTGRFATRDSLYPAARGRLGVCGRL